MPYRHPAERPMKITITLTAEETIDAVRRYAENVKGIQMSDDMEGAVVPDVPTPFHACTVIYREVKE